MEVAILKPHDCLHWHYQYNHHKRRPLLTKPNLNPNRSNRGRRNAPPPSQLQQTRSRSLSVSGQFRILKRGKDLGPSLPPPLTTTECEPEKPQTLSGPNCADGFYAGSAFVTSPPPSELPLPAFFTRRGSGGEDHNDEIACELRKVLKLQV